MGNPCCQQLYFRSCDNCRCRKCMNSDCDRMQSLFSWQFSTWLLVFFYQNLSIQVVQTGSNFSWFSKNQLKFPLCMATWAWARSTYKYLKRCPSPFQSDSLVNRLFNTLILFNKQLIEDISVTCTLFLDPNTEETEWRVGKFPFAST